MNERHDADLVGRLLGRLADGHGPSDPEAAARWQRLGEVDRQRLLWAATDVNAAAHLATSVDRWMVDLLAADRATHRRLDLVAPVLTGLLVLSTVWGFGRAALPSVAGWFLLLGLLGMALTCVIGWRRAARRRAAARAVRRSLRHEDPPQP